MAIRITAATDAEMTSPRNRETRQRRRVLKGAELTSALGAVVIGAGLALLLPQWLRGHALLVLATGVLVHGVGMTLKHRHDSRSAPLLWWERALFWLCWVCLGLLVLWIAAAWR